MMKIFANHAHLLPKEIHPEGDIYHLLKLMDDCGIEKVIAFSPFHRLWDKYSKKSLYGPIKWLAKEIKSYKDRITAFVSLNPERADAIQDLLHAIELGFCGIKLHPAADKWSLKSENAYKLYEKAQQLSIPLDFHTGVHWHRISDYHPILLDDIACDFPNLIMIFEHVGGYHFFKDMLAVLVNHLRDERKLFAGITSVLSKKNLNFWYLGPDKIEEIINQITDNRLIYGLDFPYNNTEVIKKDLYIIENLNISKESKIKLLGGNLKSLIYNSDLGKNFKNKWISQ